MKAPLHSALTVPWSAGGAPNGRNTTADPGDCGGSDPSFLVKDSNCLIFHNSWVFFDEPLHFGHVFFGSNSHHLQMLYRLKFLVMAVVVNFYHCADLSREQFDRLETLLKRLSMKGVCATFGKPPSLPNILLSRTSFAPKITEFCVTVCETLHCVDVNIFVVM